VRPCAACWCWAWCGRFCASPPCPRFRPAVAVVRPVSQTRPTTTARRRLTTPWTPGRLATVPRADPRHSLRPPPPPGGSPSVLTPPSHIELEPTFQHLPFIPHLDVQYAKSPSPWRFGPRRLEWPSATSTRSPQEQTCARTARHRRPAVLTRRREHVRGECTFYLGPPMTSANGVSVSVGATCRISTIPAPLPSISPSTPLRR